MDGILGFATILVIVMILFHTNRPQVETDQPSSDFVRATEYQQFLRSRHAAPAWTAVAGAKDFTHI